MGCDGFGKSEKLGGIVGKGEGLGTVMPGVGGWERFAKSERIALLGVRVGCRVVGARVGGVEEVATGVGVVGLIKVGGWERFAKSETIALVGVRVGCRVVGARVGAVVGDIVGVRVGTVVGDRVGVRVGDRVGVRVGDRVGVCVGAPVGDRVGVCVGAPVGVIVGSGVLGQHSGNATIRW